MINEHKIPFSKMHGAGNDFIIINQTDHEYALSAKDIRKLSDRNFGIGFDQLLIIEKPEDQAAEFKYRIFNADGAEVSQCGNGARCFFHFIKLKKLSKNNNIIVETSSGLIQLSYKDNGLVAVDMGKPIFQESKIPFIPNKKNENIIQSNNFKYNFSPISMGNPHAVIKLDTLLNDDLENIGLLLQESPMFPESVNVNFLQVLDSHNIALKVYERGSGMTLACGSGACASAVIAIKNKWAEAPVAISMDGGMLKINIKPNGNVELLGPAELVFDGEIALDTLMSHG